MIRSLRSFREESVVAQRLEHTGGLEFETTRESRRWATSAWRFEGRADGSFRITANVPYLGEVNRVLLSAGNDGKFGVFDANDRDYPGDWFRVEEVISVHKAVEIQGVGGGRRKIHLPAADDWLCGDAEEKLNHDTFYTERKLRLCDGQAPSVWHLERAFASDRTRLFVYLIDPRDGKRYFLTPYGSFQALEYYDYAVEDLENLAWQLAWVPDPGGITLYGPEGALTYDRQSYNPLTFHPVDTRPKTQTFWFQTP